MDECNMGVEIVTDLHCALTASSMTRMPSLTQILLVNFVYSLDYAFSRICKRQGYIRLINRRSSSFGVENFHMACMTLAHAQTNYHVSQFGQWNQIKAHTEQHRYTNDFLRIYVINHRKLCR